MRVFKTHSRVIYHDGSPSRPMYLTKKFEAEVIGQNDSRTKTRIRYSRNGQHFIRSWVKTDRLLALPSISDRCALCDRPRIEHHEFVE